MRGDISRLIVELYSPDPVERSKAAEELSRLGPEARVAAAPLVWAAGDESEEVAASAVAALGEWEAHSPRRSPLGLASDTRAGRRRLLGRHVPGTAGEGSRASSTGPGRSGHRPSRPCRPRACGVSSGADRSNGCPGPRPEQSQYGGPFLDPWGEFAWQRPAHQGAFSWPKVAAIRTRSSPLAKRSEAIRRASEG